MNLGNMNLGNMAVSCYIYIIIFTGLLQHQLAERWLNKSNGLFSERKNTGRVVKDAYQETEKLKYNFYSGTAERTLFYSEAAMIGVDDIAYDRKADAMPGD